MLGKGGEGIIKSRYWTLAKPPESLKLPASNRIPPGKMETVQRWLRMPPALAESIAKLGVTGKQVGDFYVESLGNLGALNKLPKGLSRDIGTEDDTASSEPSPSRASNRVYKPMRRN